MKRWRISPIALAGLLALVSGLGLITVDLVSGGALIQIDPTAQQQTIDAVVQTRLTQTAVMANTTLVEAAVAATYFATAMPFHGYAPVQHNADWQPGFETINGIEMALVPAGCFRMGNDPDAGGLDMLPGVGDGGEQCFDAPFYISRYEITNAQFDQLACTAARRATGMIRSVRAKKLRGSRHATVLREWACACRPKRSGNMRRVDPMR